MNQKSDTTSSTSTKIPNVKLALEEKYKEESSKLPHPTGWRILVLPFQKKGKTKGGILYTEEAVERATMKTDDMPEFNQGGWIRRPNAVPPLKGPAYNGIIGLSFREKPYRYGGGVY